MNTGCKKDKGWKSVVETSSCDPPRTTQWDENGVDFEQTLDDGGRACCSLHSPQSCTNALVRRITCRPTSNKSQRGRGNL